MENINTNFDLLMQSVIKCLKANTKKFKYKDKIGSYMFYNSSWKIYTPEINTITTILVTLVKSHLN